MRIQLLSNKVLLLLCYCLMPTLKIPCLYLSLPNDRKLQQEQTLLWHTLKTEIHPEVGVSVDVKEGVRHHRRFKLSHLRAINGGCQRAPFVNRVTAGVSQKEPQLLLSLLTSYSQSLYFRCRLCKLMLWDSWLLSLSCLSSHIAVSFNERKWNVSLLANTKLSKPKTKIAHVRLLQPVALTFILCIDRHHK